MPDEDFDATIASFMAMPPHKVREQFLALAVGFHIWALTTPTAAPRVVTTLKQAAEIFGVRCGDDIKRSLEAEQRMLQCWHHLFRAGVLVPGWDLELLCDSFYHVTNSRMIDFDMVSGEERTLLKGFRQELAAQKEGEAA